MRKASFENKGVYFQAFTNLSLGIERLCKICLIVNYLKCDNEYPDTTSIRRFGHNLEKLVKHISDDIASNIELSYEFEFMDIHKMIIRHLSNFASSPGRYSNINFLTEEHSIDPILEWSDIDDFIISNCLAERGKNMLRAKILEAEAWGKIPHICVSGFEDDKREKILAHVELSHKAIEREFISGDRCLYIIQIIEFLCEILYSLNRQLHPDFYLWDLNRVFATILYGTDLEKRERRNFVRDY